MAAVTYITFPDTLSSWPWPRAVNPYYVEAKAASREWFMGFGCFSSKMQKVFDACDFSEHAFRDSILLIHIDYYNTSQVFLRRTRTLLLRKVSCISTWC